MALLTFAPSFSLPFLFTSRNECATSLDLSLYLFSLPPSSLVSFSRCWYKIPSTHTSRYVPISISLCVSHFISFPSLTSLNSTNHGWEPAEWHCEFIIIQLGFFNSHILSTDGSNCETLSERTDHLCLYHKLLSSLSLPLKANRCNCSYVDRQLAHCTLIYSHTGHIHVQWNMFHVTFIFILHNI